MLIIMKDLELLSESIHAYLLQQPGVDQKYLLNHCFRVVGTTTTFEDNSVLVRYDLSRRTFYAPQVHLMTWVSSFRSQMYPTTAASLYQVS